MTITYPWSDTSHIEPDLLKLVMTHLQTNVARQHEIDEKERIEKLTLTILRQLESAESRMLLVVSGDIRLLRDLWVVPATYTLTVRHDGEIPESRITDANRIGECYRYPTQPVQKEIDVITRTGFLLWENIGTPYYLAKSRTAEIEGVLSERIRLKLPTVFSHFSTHSDNRVFREISVSVGTKIATILEQCADVLVAESGKSAGTVTKVRM